MIRTATVLCTILLTQAALAEETPRPDGTLIHYTLDRPSGASSGVIVLAQGSSCEPASHSKNLATTRAAFPDYAALIVEKAGITPDTVVENGYDDCPKDFHDRYTLSQRVEDYRIVLDAIGPIGGKLILFGGSEGGLAMAQLVGHVPADALILFSSGTGTSFGEMILDAAPAEARQHIEAGFEASRADPDSSTLFGGQTYRFWANSVDYRPLDDLLAIGTPILVIQGGLDTAGPLASARLVPDAFAKAGKCNLTYWEFPALEHTMLDPSGKSHFATIAAQAAAWTVDPVPAC